jgi:hypothetical protein
MKAKVARLKRLQRLQKRLEELSSWKLTRLDNKQRELSEAHVGMLQSLGDGLLAFGGAATAATRRIRALEVEIGQLRGEQASQSDDARRQAARSAVLNKAIHSASHKLKTATDNRSLMELIEQSLRVDRPASDKP